MIEFTEGDQRQLDDLNRRKSFYAWQQREANRTARLERLTPLVGIFTMDAVNAFVMVAGAQSIALADSDPDEAQMLANISTVMGFSGLAVVQLLERLFVAEPEPVMAADRPDGNAPAEQTPAVDEAID